MTFQVHAALVWYNPYCLVLALEVEGVAETIGSPQGAGSAPVGAVVSTELKAAARRVQELLTASGTGDGFDPTRDAQSDTDYRLKVQPFSLHVCM